jgi:hypothetical protein
VLVDVVRAVQVTCPAVEDSFTSNPVGVDGADTAVIDPDVPDHVLRPAAVTARTLNTYADPGVSPETLKDVEADDVATEAAHVVPLFVLQDTS